MKYISHPSIVNLSEVSEEKQADINVFISFSQQINALYRNILTKLENSSLSLSDTDKESIQHIEEGSQNLISYLSQISIFIYQNTDLESKILNNSPGSNPLDDKKTRHDIRNILTVIDGFAQILIGNKSLCEICEEELDSIHQNILTFTKILDIIREKVN